MALLLVVIRTPWPVIRLPRLDEAPDEKRAG